MKPFGEGRQRHYFQHDLPEELKSGKSQQVSGFMDVAIEYDETIAPKIEVLDWGIVFENQVLQPSWVPAEFIENEKKNVCVKRIKS